MGKPAARIGDMHECPVVSPGGIPHGGGPIVGPGCTTVFIEGLPAATIGDTCTCVGEPDKIVSGSTGVFIEGKEAARQGDQCAHGGVVVGGSGTVEIGERMGLIGLTGDEHIKEPFDEGKKVIINQAIKDCISLLEKKLELLQNEGPNTLSEFKDWFGRDDEEARQIILTRIKRALEVSKRLSIKNFDKIADEEDRREDHAQVYNTDGFYRFFLGDPFWLLGTGNKRSKAGVLIHELSHFKDIGNTLDDSYNEKPCLKLAKVDPKAALYNADSFEFFMYSK